MPPGRDRPDRFFVEQRGGLCRSRYVVSADVLIQTFLYVRAAVLRRIYGSAAVEPQLWNKPIFCFLRILKNVSCAYDRWVVETQLCKLCNTSDTLIGRACTMVHLQHGVCEFHLRMFYIYST